MGNASQRVVFENTSDHYVFRPLRIVPFEETRHIRTYDQEIPPDARLAVTNSNHEVPATSGQKYFWRYNGKTLVRVHERPRKGLFDRIQHRI